MHRVHNTKIIATLGPASSTKEQVRDLFDAGVATFRLNFSHGDAKGHRRLYDIIRAVEAEAGRPIGILADMQGPKIRVGSFATREGVPLVAGERFVLDTSPAPGDVARVSLPHPEIFAAVHPGVELLLNDGKIRLMVESKSHDKIHTVVVTGGQLSGQKGLSVPGVALPLKPLTQKDRADLDTALGFGVDWIALSFVQRGVDVREVRDMIAGRAGLMSKIEKPEAIKDLPAILAESDAIMVARGDLGVEMMLEMVPGEQKRLVRAARSAGKPVVVATEMLQSMMETPTPTRAEVSDVATAVYDGADAVMLSAETASGKYPVAAVRTMSRIIEQTEQDPLYHAFMAAEEGRTVAEPTSADAISAAASEAAKTLNAAAIVAYTDSGSSALRAARWRPSVPILGVTTRAATARRLTLAWGVDVVLRDTDPVDFNDMAKIAVEAAAERLGQPGKHVVIIAGVQIGKSGGTNVVRVERIPDIAKP